MNTATLTATVLHCQYVRPIWTSCRLSSVKQFAFKRLNKCDLHFNVHASVPIVPIVRNDHWIYDIQGGPKKEATIKLSKSVLNRIKACQW